MLATSGDVSLHQGHVAPDPTEHVGWGKAGVGTVARNTPLPHGPSPSPAKMVKQDLTDVASSHAQTFAATEIREPAV